jgi:HAD superfamily hydrolase (TIGR01549 family)
LTLTIHDASAMDGFPDAVLFDTDNTLYAYEPSHHAGMAAVRTKAALLFNMEGADFDRAYFAARKEVKNQLNGTASSHSRLLYFQRMLEILGLGSQILLALDMEQTYWRTFLGRAKLFDGLLQFLESLRAAGVPIAAVTDLTAQIQFRKIVYFGLDRHFDFVVTSEEAGFDKPNPAAFNLAVRKLRPKGDCLWFIGDDAVNDMRGAREALRAITFQKLHDGVIQGTGESRPDVSFEKYTELHEFFGKLARPDGHSIKRNIG